MTLLRLLIAGAFFLTALAGCRDLAPPSIPPADNRQSSTDIPDPAGTDEAPPTEVKLTLEPPVREQPASAATPTPESAERPEAAESIPVPPERNLYRLARELIPGIGEVNRVEGSLTPTLSVGHRRSFELVDLETAAHE